MEDQFIEQYRQAIEHLTPRGVKYNDMLALVRKISDPTWLDRLKERVQDLHRNLLFFGPHVTDRHASNLFAICEYVLLMPLEACRLGILIDQIELSYVTNGDRVFHQSMVSLFAMAAELFLNEYLPEGANQLFDFYPEPLQFLRAYADEVLLSEKALRTLQNLGNKANFKRWLNFLHWLHRPWRPQLEELMNRNGFVLD